MGSSPAAAEVTVEMAGSMRASAECEVRSATNLRYGAQQNYGKLVQQGLVKNINKQATDLCHKSKFYHYYVDLYE